MNQTNKPVHQRTKLITVSVQYKNRLDSIKLEEAFECGIGNQDLTPHLTPPTPHHCRLQAVVTPWWWICGSCDFGYTYWRIEQYYCQLDCTLKYLMFTSFLCSITSNADRLLEAKHNTEIIEYAMDTCRKCLFVSVYFLPHCIWSGRVNFIHCPGIAKVGGVCHLNANSNSWTTYLKQLIFGLHVLWMFTNSDLARDILVPGAHGFGASLHVLE